MLTEERTADAGSDPARAGGFLGTQVDSTSLRTPVTLKSLSNAYQRRRPADEKGLQCNTVPDTRSTASLPVCIGAGSTGAVSTQERREGQEQHTLPAPSSIAKDSCQKEPSHRGCLTAAAAQSADVIGSSHGPPANTSGVATENIGLNVGTSRVLFMSPPQGSMGVSGPYVSPTGGALQEDALQAPADAEPHLERSLEPSATPNDRKLTESEQQFLLSQDMEEGVLSLSA